MKLDRSFSKFKLEDTLSNSQFKKIIILEKRMNYHFYLCRDIIKFLSYAKAPRVLSGKKNGEKEG